MCKLGNSKYCTTWLAHDCDSAPQFLFGVEKKKKKEKEKSHPWLILAHGKNDDCFCTLTFKTIKDGPDDEIIAYQHLAGLIQYNSHPGKGCVKLLVEPSNSRPGRAHDVLVHPVTGLSLGRLLAQNTDGIVSTDMAVVALRRLIFGLNYMHAAGDMVFTGMRAA